MYIFDQKCGKSPTSWSKQTAIFIFTHIIKVLFVKKNFDILI